MASAFTCAHCGSPAPTRADGFCCDGCAAVAALLREEGMAERFYELGGGRGAPARPAAHDELGLAEPLGRIAAATGPTTVELDAQGIHCSACVWAFEALFAREAGAHSIVVNPTMGRVTLCVSRPFDLSRWARRVEGLGYALGPPEKKPDTEGAALLARTGIAIAIAMNVMSFALAEYLGLVEEPLQTTLRLISVLLTAVSVVLGAPPFFRSALAGLRARVLSLDVPIALGMILVGVATLRVYLVTGEPLFADTLSVFVALMLLGRTLEARSLARARRQLLSGEAPSLLARKVGERGIEVVPASTIVRGDRLIVAPSEALVVEARVTDAPATVALDWVTGESEPHDAPVGEVLLAGALNAGTAPLTAVASQSYASSSLRALFSRPAAREAPADAEAAISRHWTLGVLVAATATIVGWTLAGDVEAGLRATTAVLVVTCPCGLGIATPLARELARARLRAEGLFVRTARTLGVAAEIRAVVFDKTGTLTTGRPELEDDGPLLRLDRREQSIVAGMVAQSAHPRSAALARALAHVPADPAVRVTETIGKGLSGEIDGRVYRVGAPGWAGPGDGDVIVARDGVTLAELRTCERLKAGVAADVAELGARGLEVGVLSGDRRERAVSLAARAGIEPDRVVGDARPEDKASWLRAHDGAHTLFVGDGLNDLPAASVAALSGTPAIDRPFLSARTDFYFTTPGVAPITALIDVARRVRTVARRNVAFALAYNAVAVTIAASGGMAPWLAAILMPLSSLVVVGSSVAALSGEARDGAHVAPASLELAWRS